MYNYSIVIPHKNCSELLKRCLKSSPVRDDLQVIVVDDNSDRVDFDAFPGLNEPNVRVVFDKTGLGAGHARNVGMGLAEGKWLVFADCDDFFVTDAFNEQLDKWKDSQADLVFFKIRYIDSKTLEEDPKPHKANTVYDMAKSSGDYNYVRFRRNAPWAKFYRNEFIKENKISFQESRWSNDVWFSTNAALLAKHIDYSETVIYNYTFSANSLIKATSRDALLCRLSVALQGEGLLIDNGFGRYRAKHIEYWHNRLLFRFVPDYFRRIVPVVRKIGLYAYMRGVASYVKNG